jgi:methionyl-tRNA synthetase
MLLSVGAPVPTTIVTHGLLTRQGRRMSKSLGTGVDPVALARAWGVDAVRYWLLRHVPPTGDADFSDDAFASVYTSELADDLGNLVSRVVGLLHRHRGGVVPASHGAIDSELRTAAARLPGDLVRALDAFDPRAALDAVFTLVGRANRHVEEARPWTLARAEREGDTVAARRLDAVLYDLAEACRVVAEGLRPLLPETSERIAAALGASLAPGWIRGLEWGGLQSGRPVSRPEPLFPRPDLADGATGRANEEPVSRRRGTRGSGGRPPGA